MEWLDAEDTDVLHATLALVEDWCPVAEVTPQVTVAPHHDGSTSASSSDENTPVHVSKPQKPGRSINISRERRKQELAYLKSKTAELTKQLEGLQLRREAQLKSHYDGTSGQLVSTAPVWESMARRQFEARKMAEQTNNELRGKIASQVHIAQGLIRLLQRAEEERKVGYPVPSATKVRLPIDVSQRISEEDQLRRTEWLCTQWPAAYMLSDKFTGPILDFYDSHIISSDSSGIVLDVYSGSALPFPVARIKEALWHIWQSEGDVDEDEEFVQDHKVLDNTIIGVYAATFRTGGLRGTFNGKFVTRCLSPNSTQEFFVTHTYSEPTGFHHDVDGAMISEDSWLRIVAAHELGHTHLAQPLTLLQHVRRTRIGLERRQEPPLPSLLENIQKFFETQIQEEIEWAQQELENHLMRPQLMQAPPRTTTPVMMF